MDAIGERTNWYFFHGEPNANGGSMVFDKRR
jgi:hypothetical protein